MTSQSNPARKRNMFPDNIIEACFRLTKTHQVPVTVVNSTACNITDMDPSQCNYTYVRYDFDIRTEDSMNILGLVVFSLAMGVVLSVLGDVGKPLHLLCQAVAEATMMLFSVVIWYSPVGICFLIGAQIVEMRDPMTELASLGFYVLTVMIGLAIHSLIVLPLIYLAIVRSNPYKYLANIFQALVTAFGTCSSSATLPITFKCVEENNKVDRRVTRFILPIGATINMDGTALYEAIAAIYIAQINGIHLNAAQIVATSITATMASIGAATVPQAGLVTMVMVLSAIGLPADQVARVIAIDWLLDRFRTVVNVEGDCVGAAVVSHTCRRQLQQQQQQHQDAEDASSDSCSNQQPAASSHSSSEMTSAKENICLTESSSLLHGRPVAL